MVLSGLIVTRPLVPVVSTDATVSVLPAGSVSFASTLISIAVCLSVIAVSLTATGGPGCVTEMVRETTLLRLLWAAPSLAWKLTLRLPVAAAAFAAKVTDRSAAWYVASDALPVSFSTPVVALKLPVIPFLLANPSESVLATNPELIVTFAPSSVVASDELTVSVAVTGTGGAPAEYASTVDSMCAKTGGVCRMCITGTTTGNRSLSHSSGWVV